MKKCSGAAHSQKIWYGDCRIGWTFYAAFVYNYTIHWHRLKSLASYTIITSLQKEYYPKQKEYYPKLGRLAPC